MINTPDPPDPLIKLSPAGPSDVPLAELKLQLVLFVAGPPGPKTAERILNLYFDTWGDPFQHYCSTSFGDWDAEWNRGVRQRFFTTELPDLRRHRHWGYAFGDGRRSDSWSLMFHGYRPSEEPQRASFFRFQFDRHANARRLSAFALAMLEELDVVSGSAGFVFEPHPMLLKSSYDQIYAWSRRYWGVDVQDLEVSTRFLRDAYKCVSWITLIGRTLADRQPDAIAAARSAAFESHTRRGGWIFQARSAPTLGDRHRVWLQDHSDIAFALLPLQVTGHASFGEGTLSRWTEDSTDAWLYRFTDPARGV